MQFRVVLLAGLLGHAGCSGCDGGGFPTDAPAPDAAVSGTVSLAWSLTDLDGQPIACEQVGANTISLQLRQHDAANGVADSFSCNNSPTTSMAIAPGVYDISFELRGSNLTAVTAPDQRGVVVSAGHTTELAAVTFVVDARGGIVLSLAALPATSNCKPASMMGAGINSNTITLEHTGDGCAPVMFERRKGGAVVGSYVVNCSSPAVAVCLETDETLTVPSMASGPYTIHVRGKIGAVECWNNDDALQVPPQGKLLVQTLNLAFATGATGC
jgi:hypothetical protein